MKAVRATSCEVSTKNQECVARGDATNWPQACSKKEARNEHVVMPTAWCDPVHRGSCTENSRRASPSGRHAPALQPLNRGMSMDNRSGTEPLAKKRQGQ